MKFFLTVFCCAFLSLSVIAGSTHSRGGAGVDAEQITEITISSECATLADVLVGQESSSAGNTTIQCGFMAGDSRIVQSSLVLSAIKRSGVSFDGELEMSYRITRDSREIDTAELHTALLERYVGQYPAHKVEVVSIRLTRPLYIAVDGDYELIIDTARVGQTSGTVRAGRGKVGFSYTVKLFTEGYITSERIKAGENLSGKVIAALIDVTSLKSELVMDIPKLRASRALAKGKPLTADVTAPRPERVKGDAILLVYNTGTIQLEVAGVAEGEAIQGKTFPVKNSISGKTFNAVYQGDGRAIVK
ncbi:hypothetical protein RsTz2092_04050 [Deferribacterales bacterium RsTz2092]|nr:hypothetical protein AGMMS49941_02900 [Deferribacterales bacterium]